MTNLKIACIPAFNEEHMIRNVVNQTKKFVDQVIVCDDGSVDNTEKEATQAGAVVLRHEKNLGKGKAMKTLFEYAKSIKADVVITIDGDGQFLPEEIPTLITPIISGTADIVIGYRFENNEEMPKYRKIGNKMFDKFTNLASDLPFRDTQSGFRGYSKKAIELIKISTSGFGVDSQILIDAASNGLKISEKKITVIYNTGKSTSTKNPILHSLDISTTIIEIIAIKHPLKFLGIPGIIFMIIGVVFGSIMITIFNETRYFSVPSALIAMGTLTVGLLLLLMSVVLFSISRISNKNS